jgi:DNA processing protein
VGHAKPVQLDETTARVALSLRYEPGGPELAAVRTAGAAAVLAGSGRAPDLAREAQQMMRECARLGISILIPGAIGWPTQLDDLRVPPVVLYRRGTDFRPLLLRSVSIVGSRSASASGMRIARAWAAELAQRGITITSGAAFGIDGAAHQGALAASRPTVAVLAGGVDVPSPRAHRAMLEQIAGTGSIVSEAPLGAEPLRHRFLVRNRLIAALTPLTVVVQAAARSGALSTARQAADLNRIVVAVPGAVADPAHAGCHGLIRDRVAELVTSSEEISDLLEPLALQGSSTTR